MYDGSVFLESLTARRSFTKLRNAGPSSEQLGRGMVTVCSGRMCRITVYALERIRTRGCAMRNIPGARTVLVSASAVDKTDGSKWVGNVKKGAISGVEEASRLFSSVLLSS